MVDPGQATIIAGVLAVVAAFVTGLFAIRAARRPSLAPTPEPPRSASNAFSVDGSDGSKAVTKAVRDLLRATKHVGSGETALRDSITWKEAASAGWAWTAEDRKVDEMAKRAVATIRAYAVHGHRNLLVGGQLISSLAVT